VRPSSPPAPHEGDVVLRLLQRPRRHHINPPRYASSRFAAVVGGLAGTHPTGTTITDVGTAAIAAAIVRRLDCACGLYLNDPAAWNDARTSRDNS
jgi:hypothetical protein